MGLSVRHNITPVVGAGIAVVGLLLAAVAVDHVFVEHWDPVAILLGGLVPTGLALGVVGGGVHLARSGTPPRRAGRVVGWWLLGMSVTASMGFVAVVYASSHGVAFPDGFYVVTNNVTAGAVGGLAVGLYDARSRRRAEALSTEREKLTVLNQILSHDVRNDLNVVLLLAELLEERVDDGTRTYVRRLERAATEAVELTETTTSFLETIDREGRDTGPVPLRAVVDSQVERTREAYPSADVRRGPIPDVSVVADDLLPTVVRNILSNAVQHNHADEPLVEVDAERTGDTVVLRVADDGPGVPDDRKEEVFGRGERGLESEGSGIGLYLVDTLTREYGGSVWVEDNVPEGAVFSVELPLAREDRDANGDVPRETAPVAWV